MRIHEAAAVTGLTIDEIAGLSRLSCAWIHDVIEPDSDADGITGDDRSRRPVPR